MLVTTGNPMLRIHFSVYILNFIYTFIFYHICFFVFCFIVFMYCISGRLFLKSI